MVEFPPHKFNGPQNHPNPIPTITNPQFSGSMVDYVKMIAQSAHRAQPEFNLYRGIIPGWDNTARRQNSPTIVVNNHPELYGAWLSYLRAYTRHTQAKPENSFLFINAWNEWGEGCHLEPDLRWGLRFLEETKRSIWYDSADIPLAASRARLAALVREIIKTQHIPAAPDISVYRPKNPLVPKFSLALQRFPALHRLIRWFYHRAHALLK